MSQSPGHMVESFDPHPVLHITIISQTILTSPYDVCGWFVKEHALRLD